MSLEKIIGLDVGTSSVKGAVIDVNGNIHARFSQSYSTHRRGLHIIEQNPQDWIFLVEKALQPNRRYPPSLGL